MTITERKWCMENAAEHVVTVFDSETGEQSHIAIMNENGIVYDEIDKHHALALAALLIELAIELPEPRAHLPRTTIKPTPALKRLSVVDDQLREMDQ